MKHKMSNAKIVQQLTKNTFIIELEEQDDLQIVDEIQIEHDYVKFSGNYSIFVNWEKCSLIEQNDIKTNFISLRNTVQIPIYGFYKVVLPMLNNNKYLQPSHVLQPSRNSKGEIIQNSINYSYCNTVFKYYDKEKSSYMYYVKMENETEYNIVTEKFYKKFIEPSL